VKGTYDKTDKLNRALDDAKDQLVTALENVEAQAIADEIGRPTRKTTHSPQAEIRNRIKTDAGCH
jgi:hypothetical protein